MDVATLTALGRRMEAEEPRSSNGIRLESANGSTLVIPGGGDDAHLHRFSQTSPPIFPHRLAEVGLPCGSRYDESLPMAADLPRRVTPSVACRSPRGRHPDREVGYAPHCR